MTEFERNHGRRLGELIAAKRRESSQSAEIVARASDVSTDTLRSLETGRIGTPTFLTVARVARVLGMNLDQLHDSALGIGGER